MDEVYIKYSSFFGKKLIDFLVGNLSDEQIIKETPDKYLISVKCLIGLKLEIVDKSFIKAVKYYKDVYNNANDLYYWIAGQRLGLINLKSNLPPDWKDYGVTKINVSSCLDNKNYKYSASNLIDDNLNTAWVEGKSDSGIGEWITLQFEFNTTIKKIKIINGYAKNLKLYNANNRVKEIIITLSNGITQNYKFEDNNLGYQIINLNESYQINELKITILDIYKGSEYNDTCISEIKFE